MLCWSCQACCWSEVVSKWYDLPLSLRQDALQKPLDCDLEGSKENSSMTMGKCLAFSSGSLACFASCLTQLSIIHHFSLFLSWTFQPASWPSVSSS